MAALGAERVALDWGGGLIWAALPAGEDARARLAGSGGAEPVRATLVRAAAGAPAPHPEPRPESGPESGPVAALSAGLRARFDPRGILNPGAMATLN